MTVAAVAPLPSPDCSTPRCSSSCPQFCSFPLFLSPPPPLSSAPLSPLLISLIAVLLAALLLLSYYAVVSRLRRRNRPTFLISVPPPELRRDAAPAPAPALGLEEWVIRRISVCKYKKGDGLVMTTECPVCLAEFSDGESLRLLPDCLHAFHVDCIDTWLKSHTNCPICRSNIDLEPPVPPPVQPPAPVIAR